MILSVPSASQDTQDLTGFISCAQRALHVLYINITHSLNIENYYLFLMRETYSTETTFKVIYMFKTTNIND